LWIQAFMGGVHVTLFQIVGMRLRRAKAVAIIRARIMAVQARIPGAELADLERHSGAGGNVINVVTALVTAAQAGVPMDFARAAAMDLAGMDVLADTRTKAAAALARGGLRARAVEPPPVG
jgi:uncharacterized protein YqfA (UPF0365 family)